MRPTALRRIAAAVSVFALAASGTVLVSAPALAAPSPVLVASAPAECPTSTVAVSPANFRTVFDSRDPGNVIVPALPAANAKKWDTVAFEATGARFTLPFTDSRIRWLHELDTPLSIGCLGVPSLTQVANPSGGSAQAIVDLDGDGTYDGGLYTDGTYEWAGESYLNTWLGDHGYLNHPVLDAASGPQAVYTGTAEEWLDVFPDAEIQYIGVGVGRFAQGDVLISSVSVAGTTFTFSGSAAVCPTETIPVTDANHASVFQSREPGAVTVPALPAANTDGPLLAGVTFDATGATFTLPYGTSRVRWLHEVDLPLACLGVPSLTQVKNPSGGSGQAIVDLDGDGAYDGGLYTDGTYEWTAESILNSWLDGRLYEHHPVLDDASDGTGKYTGTADEWLAAFPDARIDYVGVGVGRFATGTTLMTSVVVAGTTFDFVPDTTVDAPETAYPNGWHEDVDHFEWTPVTDPNGPVTYEVAIGDHPTNATNIITPVGGVTGTTYAYDLPVGPVQWRVRAIDALGNVSPWSEVQGAQHIGTPSIVTPTSGQRATGTSFPIRWTPVYGVGGLDAYELEFTVDRNHDGTTETEYRTVNDPVWTSATTLAQYTQQFSTYEGELAVRVRGVYNIPLGGSVNGPWSAAVSYYRDSTGPAAPQPDNPENGRMQADATPLLDWQPVTDGYSNPVTYEVRTSTSPGRSPDTNNGQLNGSDAATVTGITDSEYQLGAQAQGWLWWQVRAVDALGNKGPWSNIWATGIDTVAPTVTLLTPLDLSTVDVHDFSLTWSASESGVTYDIQSSLAPDRDPVTNELLSLIDTLTGRTPAFLEVVGVPDDTFYWQVRATDAAGNVGPWTVPFEVTVDADEDIELPTESPGDGDGGTPSGGTPSSTGGSGTTSSATAGGQLTTYALDNEDVEVTDEEEVEEPTPTVSDAPEAAPEVAPTPAGFDAGLLWLIIALSAAMVLLLAFFLFWLRRRSQSY